MMETMHTLALVLMATKGLIVMVSIPHVSILSGDFIYSFMTIVAMYIIPC